MEPVWTWLQRRRKGLLVIHIVASVALIGATSSSLMSAVVAATTSDAQLAHSAYRLISTASFVFGIPLSFISLATGLVLGTVTKWGVVRYRWTAAKLVLIVIVILNGALAIGPTTEARLVGERPEWMLPAVISATVLMLLVAVVLSVLKPGGRLRRAGG
jgi:hypothetical protein